MKILKSAKGLLVAAALAVTAVAYTAAPVAADGLIEEITKRGKLRVGMSTFVPWAMRDKSGDLVGFEIDVATRLAEDMGVEVEFVPTAWSGIVPALLAKKFDVIIGGLSVTPERNMTVNFTDPYAHSGQTMAANTELAGDFDTLEDFNDTSVTFVCRRGVTSCDEIRKQFPKATLRQFDDEAQAFQEVVNGNAHAIMSSAPKPELQVAAYPDKLHMANDGETLTEGNEAIAVRKGDVDSLNFFSNWILVRQSDGWLKERHDYWFKNVEAWQDDVDAE